MINFMKKTVLTGIGLALKTRDEVTEIARDLAEKGKLSEEDGKKLIDEFMDKYEETKKNLEQKVEKTVKDVLAKTDLASRQEVESLRQEVVSLRQELESAMPEKAEKE